MISLFKLDPLCIDICRSQAALSEDQQKKLRKTSSLGQRLNPDSARRREEARGDNTADLLGSSSEDEVDRKGARRPNPNVAPAATRAAPATAVAASATPARAPAGASGFDFGRFTAAPLASNAQTHNTATSKRRKKNRKRKNRGAESESDEEAASDEEARNEYTPAAQSDADAAAEEGEGEEAANGDAKEEDEQEGEENSDAEEADEQADGSGAEASGDEEAADADEEAAEVDGEEEGGAEEQEEGDGEGAEEEGEEEGEGEGEGEAEGEGEDCSEDDEQNDSASGSDEEGEEGSGSDSMPRPPADPFFSDGLFVRGQLQQMGHVPELQHNVLFVPVQRTPEVMAQRKDLPILMEETAIMEHIREHDVVIICGETGCGKTTQVPQFLYEAGFGSGKGPHPGTIGITEPRRVAAVTVAQRVRVLAHTRAYLSADCSCSCRCPPS